MVNIAELHSADASCRRAGPNNWNPAQNAILRYSRVKLCATRLGVSLPANGIAGHRARQRRLSTERPLNSPIDERNRYGQIRHCVDEFVFVLFTRMRCIVQTELGAVYGECALV